MSLILNALTMTCKSCLRFTPGLRRLIKSRPTIIGLSTYCTWPPFSTGKFIRKIAIPSSCVNSMSGSQRWFGTMYWAAKVLKELPAIFTLDTTLKSLLVDNLPSDLHDEAFNLIQDSAARGDNVGIDEFPTLKDLKDLLESSAAFSLRDVGSDQLLGLIIVQPSNYSRSLAPYLATIYVITATDISHKSHWRDLARLTERLVVRLRLRYGACLTSVFCSCVDRLLALTEEGYHVTACINESGTLAGSKNLTSTYILYKDLRLTPQPKYSLSEIRTSVDNALDSSHGDVSTVSAPSFLPVDHVMRDGTEVVLRSMRADEASLFHEKFGRGLGFDEWPTEKYFERMVLSRGCAVIVEDRRTGSEVVGIILSPSGYSRGTSARLVDNYFAVNVDYVGRGIGKEIAGICQQLAAELGYTAVQTDTAVSNIASVNTLLSDGFVMTGVIPKSIYKLDEGWVDAALFFKKISNKPSKQIITFGQNSQKPHKR